jgi:uncharacterized membrane protein YeaQ/YmgE (transglycosylase-associated protein family)
MLYFEILGWIAIGATVGYFWVDIPRVHRVAVIPAMIIGAGGAIAGGFVGYAISGRPLLGEDMVNLLSIVTALIGAGLTTFVVVVYRRFRPAHQNPA